MVTTMYGGPIKVHANPYKLTGVIKNVVVLGDIAFADLYQKNKLVGRCTNHGGGQGWVIRAVQS